MQNLHSLKLKKDLTFRSKHPDGSKGCFDWRQKVKVTTEEAINLAKYGYVDFEAENQEKTKVVEKIVEEPKKLTFEMKHSGRGIYDIYANGSRVVNNFGKSGVTSKEVELLNAMTDDEAEARIIEIIEIQESEKESE